MNTVEPSAAPRDVRYRFGEFELDLSAYALTRAGDPVHIRRKAFDVLRFLIEHRDRVVTKEELLDALWADSQVAQVAVPWTICHVRRVLGQSTAEKHPIETVHGRGYRFVAEVDVRAARVSAPPPSSGLPSTPAPPESPFVGRQQAMALLNASLAEARTGRGSLAALVGEAGIGKTRCVDELAVRARAEGFVVCSGRSTEDTVVPVFWPWIQVLRDIASQRPAMREAAQGLLARLHERHPAADVTVARSGHGSFWLFDGMSSLLRDTARGGPVMLVLEDLHWADLGSLQLLSFVCPELHEHAILIVTTQRDGAGARDGARELRRLSRHASARFELGPLTPNQIGQYVGLVTQTVAADLELSIALHRATAGNPLFLLQTVNGLIDRHGRDTLRSLAPELVEPAKSARDVLCARLESLDDRARRVLEIASVLGEYFELSTLQGLCGLETDDLLAALEAASEEKFVIPAESNDFRFRHALLRAALYDNLGASDRANLHRGAARTLERSAPESARSSEIAHHYYRSIALGEYGRVVAAAAQAAHAAAHLQAFSDAANFCRWALEAQALDPSHQPRARAELLRLQAHWEQLAGNGQDALRTIALLVDIAHRHGYTELLLEAAHIIRPTHLMGSRADAQVCTILEDAVRAAPEGANALRIKALSRLSWIPPYAFDMERSKELSAEALALARQCNEQDPLLVALHARLYALSGPDDFVALLEVTDEMLRRDASPRTMVSLEALSARHAALIYRGDLIQAEAARAGYGSLAREHKWPAATWTHDRLCAQRKLLEGEFAAAEIAIEDLRARSKRLRLSHGAALCGIMLAALAVQRDGPRAVASHSDASRFSLAIHDAMPSVRPSIGRLCVRLGQYGAAKSVLEGMVTDDGLLLPKETSYLNAVANLGMLAISLDDQPRAERIYEELARYPHHNTPDAVMLYEGSVSYFLARLAAFLDKAEQVGRHFDDALAMNEQLGLRPQLARSYLAYARWLLGRTSTPSRKIGRDLQSRGVELAETLGMCWLAAAARSTGSPR